MRTLRIPLVAVSLALLAGPAASQVVQSGPSSAPAPDSSQPVAAHVRYLLRHARNGFADLRDPGASPNPASARPSLHTSYAFGGRDAGTAMIMSASGAIAHVTPVAQLPEAGARAVADSLKSQIGAALPGWIAAEQPFPQGKGRMLTWSECRSPAEGRVVAVTSGELPNGRWLITVSVDKRSDRICKGEPG